MQHRSADTHRTCDGEERFVGRVRVQLFALVCVLDNSYVQVRLAEASKLNPSGNRSITSTCMRSAHSADGVLASTRQNVGTLTVLRFTAAVP